MLTEQEKINYKNLTNILTACKVANKQEEEELKQEPKRLKTLQVRASKRADNISKTTPIRIQAMSKTSPSNPLGYCTEDELSETDIEREVEFGFDMNRDK